MPCQRSFCVDNGFWFNRILWPKASEPSFGDGNGILLFRSFSPFLLAAGSNWYFYPMLCWKCRNWPNSDLLTWEWRNTASKKNQVEDILERLSMILPGIYCTIIERVSYWLWAVKDFDGQTQQEKDNPTSSVIESVHRRSLDRENIVWISIRTAMEVNRQSSRRQVSWNRLPWSGQVFEVHRIPFN